MLAIESRSSHTLPCYADQPIQWPNSSWAAVDDLCERTRGTLHAHAQGAVHLLAPVPEPGGSARDHRRVHRALQRRVAHRLARPSATGPGAGRGADQGGLTMMIGARTEGRRGSQRRLREGVSRRRRKETNALSITAES